MTFPSSVFYTLELIQMVTDAVRMVPDATLVTTDSESLIRPLHVKFTPATGKTVLQGKELLLRGAGVQLNVSAKRYCNKQRCRVSDLEACEGGLSGCAGVATWCLIVLAKREGIIPADNITNEP